LPISFPKRNQRRPNAITRQAKWWNRYATGGGGMSWRRVVVQMQRLEIAHRRRRQQDLSMGQQHYDNDGYPDMDLSGDICEVDS